MIQQPASASILAFVTTLHLALVVLRVHRSAGAGPVSFVSSISVLFSISPWLLSSPLGLAAGFFAHGCWFAACEHLLPKPLTTPTAPPASRRTPARTSIAAPAPTKRALEPTAPRSSSTPRRDFVATPVVAVFDETPDTRTFRMARPDGFEFTAGQFLTVRFRAESKEHVRCYSISSAPGSRGHLEITVKRLGMVSGALHASVRPGSMLHVRPPAGAFVYPSGDDRPLVLIAGGVGITPLMSMVRHALEEEPTRSVSLFYSVRTVNDIAFHDELAMLNRRHKQFSAFIAITDGPVSGEYFPGRINDALLTTMAPDIAHAICLMCGPQPMLESMTTLLQALGVPRAQINYEIFQAAVAASARPAKTAGAVHDVDPPPRLGHAAAHQVAFARSGITGTAAPGQKLLDVSEACGAAIPSLCRAGVCGTCRTKVTSGDVDCASQLLDDEDRRNGYVLACVSDILSDCTVEA